MTESWVSSVWSGLLKRDYPLLYNYLEGIPNHMEWTPNEYRTLPIEFQQARALLEGWFRAIESGQDVYRMPDPEYMVTLDADSIVAKLDEEITKELSWAGTANNGGFTKGPGFSRLLPVQRLALAQDLHRILGGYKEKMKAPIGDDWFQGYNPSEGMLD